MLIRLGVGLGVICLALASLSANYEYVKGYGAAYIGLVMAAEALKPFLLPAAILNLKRDETSAGIAAGLIWSIVVVFSFVNTFGNTMMRHAIEQAKVESAKAGELRPEHVVLKEIASLPPCKSVWDGKGKNAKKREICPDGRADKVAALQAEIKRSRELTKADPTKALTTQVHVDDTPIRDGLVALSAMAGFAMRKEMVFIYVALLWTFLAEFGSAFGGLAIPSKRK